MAGPSAEEQYLLELINETRMDPLGSAARYITSYGPTLRSQDAGIQNALTYFQVNGAALKAAYEALTPVQPLAWNENLAGAARSHNQVMIQTDSQTHQAPGEPDIGQRATNAGYTGWSNLGENVFAYSENPLYAHAGFMVDWGNGPDGMQSPAGHRVSIMNGAYREIGIGITAETNAATQVGPQVTSQEFGARAAAPRFVTGVAYSDANGNDFYGVGEGRGDLIVATGGRSMTSYMSGGYQLGLGGAGSTVTLSGGGLAGTVTVVANDGSGNIKLDVMSGTELKAYGNVTVSGSVSVIEGLGTAARIAVAGSGSYVLKGTVGGDALTGAGGHDNLFGGAGGDTLSGGAGNDHLYGQSASGGADGADMLSGGDGSDYLQGNAGRDTLDGGDGSDRLNGGGDGDLILGGAGNDSVNGNLGDDVIDGGGDNDSLRGGQGADSILGGVGDDLLSGDLGQDTLVGGSGLDVLSGGADADVFRFAAGDAAFASSGARAYATDAVLDFVDGVDRIALGFAPSAVVASAAQGSVAGAAAAAQALIRAGEVAAVQVGGDTMLFWASGGGAVDSAIRLTGVGVGAIGGADFI